MINRQKLVYRLAYNGDVAAGQLAVFQGASEAPISGSIRALVLLPLEMPFGTSRIVL
jgi:hypothetical protein